MRDELLTETLLKPLAKVPVLLLRSAGESNSQGRTLDWMKLGGKVGRPPTS